MSDDELRQLLRRAYLPYVRGFLDDPQAARLRIDMTASLVRGTLVLAPGDFATFDRDGAARGEQSRAFNNLLRWNDDRRPLLVFEAAA